MTTASKVYGSYNFKDKDPVLDVLRSMVELEMKVQGRTFNGMLKRIADDTGISYGCFLGWFYGITVSPKYASVVRFAHACGCEVEITGEAARSRKRFKVAA